MQNDPNQSSPTADKQTSRYRESAHSCYAAFSEAQKLAYHSITDEVIAPLAEAIRKATEDSPCDFTAEELNDYHGMLREDVIFGVIKHLKSLGGAAMWFQSLEPTHQSLIRAEYTGQELPWEVWLERKCLIELTGLVAKEWMEAFQNGGEV